MTRLRQEAADWSTLRPSFKFAPAWDRCMAEAPLYPHRMHDQLTDDSAQLS